MPRISAISRHRGVLRTSFLCPIKMTNRHTRRRTTKPNRCREQGELFVHGWGGARKGAGRKRTAPRPLVPHRERESFRAGCPAHVTLRLAPGLPSLRRHGAYRAFLHALALGGERFGLRVVHWSALGNHLHLMVEARDRRALSRGMQGLAVRIARALNRLWRRTGRVFADRYHARALRSPREVRAALGYVLSNARRHGIALAGADPFSSGVWFDGWRGAMREGHEAMERPGWLRAARTWLLARGWRRLGLLDVRVRPGKA